MLMPMLLQSLLLMLAKQTLTISSQNMHAIPSYVSFHFEMSRENFCHDLLRLLADP